MTTPHQTKSEGITPTHKATLSCKHVAELVRSALPAVGDKISCYKCPAARGRAATRTIKAIKTLTDPHDAPAPTADELAAEIAADDEVARIAAGIENEDDFTDVVTTFLTKSPAAARMDRLNKAKAVAADGGDAAAVLAEPVPATTKTGKTRKPRAGRVTFLNLSPVRIAALLAAGFPQDRLEASSVDLQAADVQFLLDELPKVCTSERPEAKAACRVADWLEKFRA